LQYIAYEETIQDVYLDTCEWWYELHVCSG